MIDQATLSRIIDEVLTAYLASPAQDAPALPDLTSAETKARVLIDAAENEEAVRQMKKTTSARIGVGRSGPRLKTETLLTLRADHAAARDAVFTDVPEALLDELGLFSVQTVCRDKNEFLTRPDLGRVFDAEAERTITQKCKSKPQVQIYLSDGLSSKAIEANARDVLPPLMDGLADLGLTVGTPFFVKYGRVPAMDRVSELTGAEVTCVLIGERPGLATPESMSAYIVYRATAGMPEARRTVVSNIHAHGTPAVEAGAYIAELIAKILKARASGVELKQ